jgi:hypothetical protein
VTIGCAAARAIDDLNCEDRLCASAISQGVQHPFHPGEFVIEFRFITARVLGKRHEQPDHEALKRLLDGDGDKDNVQ